MDPFAIEFENLVNSFTDVEELMSFATFWDIHDLAVVRMRLFLLRNPQLDNVMDYSAQFQNDDDLELALEFVREQKEFMQVNTLSIILLVVFF